MKQQLESPEQSDSFPTKLIDKGRLYSSILIVCYVFAMTIMLLVLDLKYNYEERQDFSKQFNDYGVLVFQITDFTLLTSSIGILFYLLAKQEKHMDSKETFRKERCLLLTILIVFNFSFVMRALYDDLLAEDLKEAGDDFANAVMLTFTGTVFDFIPISLILYLHGKNLETIQPDGP